MDSGEWLVVSGWWGRRSSILDQRPGIHIRTDLFVIDVQMGVVAAVPAGAQAPLPVDRIAVVAFSTDRPRLADPFSLRHVS